MMIISLPLQRSNCLNNLLFAYLYLGKSVVQVLCLDLRGCLVSFLSVFQVSLFVKNISNKNKVKLFIQVFIKARRELGLDTLVILVLNDRY